MNITITHTLDPINVLAVFAAITIGGSVIWPLAEMLERRVVRYWEAFLKWKNK